MKSGNYVAYYRVSTMRQGQSGLGIDAQKKAVTDYLDGGECKLISEYTEVESGKKSRRPELEKAIRDCRQQRATLVIAKLDRLARNVHFISGLMQSKIDFVAADMPHANNLIVHIMAAFAEFERDQISERTRKGLERAKARGVKLGTHGKVLARSNRAEAMARVKRLRPVIRQIRKTGKSSVRAIMDELNARGIKAARGDQWHPQTVSVLLHRLDRTAPARRVG